LTVQEHVKIWRKLKTASFEDVQVDDDDILAECDLLDKVQAPAKTLSGGQMRKLQLAISFVGGSKVCCVDEASSGLVILSFIHLRSLHSNLFCIGPPFSTEHLEYYPEGAQPTDNSCHNPLLG
jgi:ABC-type multidrug transport system ATPase subunit